MEMARGLEIALRKPNLFALGGAHLDRRGRIRGAYVPESSNPGNMREEVGGGAFNATRAAVQRGISVSLLSLRGGDAAGEYVAGAIEAAGITDLSVTFLDRATPSYTAMLTEEGDLVAGLADMELYEFGFAKQLRRRKLRAVAAEADAVLCDANMPSEAIELLAGLVEEKPIFAIAVSPAKAPRFIPVMDRLSCLFMNRREASDLAGLPLHTPPREVAMQLCTMGLKAGVITAGSAPTLCFTQNTIFEIATPPIGRIVDVTGAGDALAGTCTAALMRGMPLAEAVREGMAAAKLTVESDRAAPVMSSPAFDAALALVPSSRVLA